MTVLSSAFELANAGFHVFPVRANKRPATPNGWKDATLNMGQIATWFGNREDMGIGIATGPSGLAVIDIDVKNGVDGYATWEELCATYGYSELPDTPTVYTPSGGQHIYFKGKVACSAGKLGPGLDVRSIGGYVVAPPSSGYTWGSVSLFDEDPLYLPEWLEALTRIDYTPPVAEGNEREYIRDGERHDTTVRIAGCLRRLGFGQDAIFRGLTAITNELCETPCDTQALARRASYAAGWQCGSSTHDTEKLNDRVDFTAWLNDSNNNPKRRQS